LCWTLIAIKPSSTEEENAAAAEIQLSAEDLARIDAAAPVGATAGDRYADMSPIEG
jgi:aryl-alcohol dehydrogenase-like predicted oxidoreductase